ncbi:regulatory-associated protein of mtor [Anaeramoeba flamelloides]|uniref:Regulatory-associated protein of mtor n=1 Tax=Anaeramoeba flamelloides TaxID=1746091 RepID=A0AAV7YR99_9EUKA|nr:regulatory-associated protein of mtor [Anaeramoeba flamelloides]
MNKKTKNFYRFTNTLQLSPNNLNKKKKSRTVTGILVMCLNIGVDPPDFIKPDRCAKLECWVDPGEVSRSKVLEKIGCALQKQYETLEPRARYRSYVDTPYSKIKEICKITRSYAKRERILFHYNGHGVPRPTKNQEIWVFNQDYTQYVPLLFVELQSWIRQPCTYVFDCSFAGILAPRIGKKNTSASFPEIALFACQENEMLPTNSNMPADLFTSCLTTPIKTALRWHFYNKISKNSFLQGIRIESFEKIPGKLNDRRTFLGELNWTLQSITDTIAWNCLPPNLFQKLYRQDQLTASLFRNFLLAERILCSLNCNPFTIPEIPTTSNHHLWDAWDHCVDLALIQLSEMNEKTKLKTQSFSFFDNQLKSFEIWLSSPKNNCINVLNQMMVESVEYLNNDQSKSNETQNNNPKNNKINDEETNNHGNSGTISQNSKSKKISRGGKESNSRNSSNRSFSLISKSQSVKSTSTSQSTFSNNFSQFEDSLQKQNPNSLIFQQPPEQLPILLQVLFSSLHCKRALILLSKFLDLGPSAIYLALNVGISPYMLRLLKSSSKDLQPILTFNWAKIIVFDPDCKMQLIRDGSFQFFIELLKSSDPFQLYLSSIVLTMVQDNYPHGKKDCLNLGIQKLLLSNLNSDNYNVRQWSCLCLAKFWEDFDPCKNEAILRDSHEKLFSLLNDPIPIVRACAIYSLNTLLSGAKLDIDAKSDLLNSLKSDQQFNNKLVHVNFNKNNNENLKNENKVNNNYKIRENGNEKEKENSDQKKKKTLNIGNTSIELKANYNTIAKKETTLSEKNDNLIKREESHDNAHGINKFKNGNKEENNKLGNKKSKQIKDKLFKQQSKNLKLKKSKKKNEIKVNLKKKKIEIELNIALTLIGLKYDGSPLVRNELLIIFSKLFYLYEPNIKKKFLLDNFTGEENKGNLFSSLDDFDTVFYYIWIKLKAFRTDPYPIIAKKAKKIVTNIKKKWGNDQNESDSNLNRSLHLENDDENQNFLNDSKKKKENINNKKNANTINKRRIQNIKSVKTNNKKSPNSKNVSFQGINQTTSKQFKKHNIQKTKSEDNINEGGNGLTRFQPLNSNLFQCSSKNILNPLLNSKSKDEIEKIKNSYFHRKLIDRTKYSLVQYLLKKENNFKSIDKQINILDNQSTNIDSIVFHPVEPILISSDGRQKINVWDWGQEGGKLIKSFNNTNLGDNCKLSFIALADEEGDTSLITSTDNGVINVWGNFISENLEPRLVTSWNAVENQLCFSGNISMGGGRGGGVKSMLRDDKKEKNKQSPRNQRKDGLKIPVDWNQINGNLTIYSSDSNYIRVWDVAHKQSSLTIPINPEIEITSIQSDSLGDKLLYTGSSDGRLLLYDIRVDSKLQPVRSAKQHNNAIFSVLKQIGRSRQLISGSKDGIIKFWDTRTFSSTKTLKSNKQELSSLALHDHAPFIATGSKNQYFSTFNLNGKILSTVTNYETFLWKKPGPVSTLQFHPYHIVIAAGSESLISIFKQK